MRLVGVTQLMDMSLSKPERERQGSPVCGSPQGYKELGMTEQQMKRKVTNCIVYYLFVVLSLDKMCIL